MNAPAWIIILVSAGTDFVVVAGTALMTAMLATPPTTPGHVALPSAGYWLLAAIGGIVAAGKEVRASLHLPDVPKAGGA